MPWRRAIGLALLWLLAAPPLIGLVAGVLIDLSPDNHRRIGLFPLALALSDPTIRACARASTLAAAIAATGSYIFGIGLARLTARWRFWGRPLLLAGAWIGWLTPPACAAYGLQRLLADDRAISLRNWADGSLGPRWTGLLMLAAVGMLSGVPLVAAAVHRVFAGIGDAGEDAAIALGATRKQTWRRLYAPAVRRHAAATSAVIFSWWLVEPATPLVLGLRDTLGMRLATLAVDPAPGTGNQLAATALLALFICALAAGAVRLIWGEPPRLARAPLATSNKGRGTGWLRGMFFILILAAWCALATAAWWGLLRPVGSAYSIPDPAWQRAALRSLAAALIAWPILVAVARATSGRGGGLARLIERTPPIAIGVGLLGLIQSARALIGPARMGTDPLDWLDPRSEIPWMLAWALAIAHLPLALRLRHERAPVQQSPQSDVARVVGISRIRIRSLERIARRSVAGLVLPLALCAHAACTFPAAFVLSPVSTEQVAIGKAVRDIRRGEPLDPGIALAMLGLQAVALGVSLRAGITPAPEHRRP